MMLRLIFLIVMVQCMHRAIMRHCLCYDMAQDGPVEPWRVRVFRCLLWLAAFAWPIAAGWMLMKSEHCDSQLKLAVELIIGYYCALVAVAIILPFSVFSVMLCLIRRGILALPRTPWISSQKFPLSHRVLRTTLRRILPLALCAWSLLLLIRPGAWMDGGWPSSRHLAAMSFIRDA
eukprot:symbB.v1.2.024686.t1/scaffold2339.1/size83576/5